MTTFFGIFCSQLRRRRRRRFGDFGNPLFYFSKF
jgi:hypothetical protein